MISKPRPSLLVLDTSYTFEMIRMLGNQESVTCRDLDGFFRHVWSVHPFASLLTSESWSPRYGKPVWHDMGPRHTFIEGKVGRFGWLSFLFPVNFLIGQIGLFLSLWALIRREDIRVIRVGDPLYLGLFGLALKAVTGLPILIRINGNNDKIRGRTGVPLSPRLFRTIAMEKRIEKYVMPRMNIVAAPSHDYLDFAVDNGAERQRCTIFRYGNLLASEHLTPPAERKIDLHLFEKLGLEPGKFLLSVGRLQPLKHLDDTLHVLAAVVGKGHDIKLFFAGDGELRQELLALATELRVSDRFIIGGNQDQATLAQLNTNCAVLLSPFTGRALSESALGAAPIVAYDYDWQGDLVHSGITGELVAFRDIEAMTTATIGLLQDRPRARRLGEAARKRALEMFDRKALDAHERDTYTRLMDGRLPLPGT